MCVCVCKGGVLWFLIWQPNLLNFSSVKRSWLILKTDHFWHVSLILVALLLLLLKKKHIAICVPPSPLLLLDLLQNHLLTSLAATTTFVILIHLSPSFMTLDHLMMRLVLISLDLYSGSCKMKRSKRKKKCWDGKKKKVFLKNLKWTFSACWIQCFPNEMILLCCSSMLL